MLYAPLAHLPAETEMQYASRKSQYCNIFCTSTIITNQHDVTKHLCGRNVESPIIFKSTICSYIYYKYELNISLANKVHGSMSYNEVFVLLYTNDNKHLQYDNTSI